MGRNIPSGTEHTAIPADRDDEFYRWQDIRSSSGLCRKLEPLGRSLLDNHTHAACIQQGYHSLQRLMDQRGGLISEYPHAIKRRRGQGIS